MAKGWDRGSKVKLAAASPSLPRDEKIERQHTRTAKMRLGKAKKKGKR